MYQSILFPIDIGSIDSYEENFTAAKALSNASTTKWHLIYVDVYSSVNSYGFDFPDLSFSAEPRKDMIETLDRFASKIDYPRNQIKTIVRSGAVMNEILKYAGQGRVPLRGVASGYH